MNATLRKSNIVPVFQERKWSSWGGITNLKGRIPAVKKSWGMISFWGEDGGGNSNFFSSSFSLFWGVGLDGMGVGVGLGEVGWGCALYAPYSSMSE